MTNSERISALRRLPWYSIEPPVDVRSGVGMIGVDERRTLYTLTKDYYSGAGRIIDGGSFLGSSSLALGLGLKDRDFPKEKVINVFDWFIIDEPGVRLHLDPSDRLSQKIKPGDNVRFLYDRNVADVAEYILVHEGDVRLNPWKGGPIEILFVDISKDLDTNDFIIKNWLPALLPETGILIQQDQVQQYHVWVAITMEMLADYFEVIDYMLNSSMIYRLKYEIPGRVLERCLSKNVSHSDMEFYYTNFLERFRRVGMGRFTGWQLGMVELGLAIVYGFHIGDVEKARYTLSEIERKFSNVADTMFRLAEIKKHLTGQKPCPGSRVWVSSQALPAEKGTAQYIVDTPPKTVQRSLKAGSGPCGHVDHCVVSEPQLLSLSGWAADLDMEASIIDVRVWVDGKLAQRCLPFISRPDVAKHLDQPSAETSGWQCLCLWDGNRDKLLVVTAVNNFGTERMIESGSIESFLVRR